MSDSEFANDSDQDVAKSHSKLLEAVAQLDKGQRIKKPERSEPTLEVSEFHLVKSGISDKDAVRVQDLAKSLGKKGHHTEIARKLQVVQKKTKVLRKPLEKPAADRIKRIVGFENTQKEVKKWDAIIARNRTVERIAFPLNQTSTRPDPSKAFIKRFRIQSDLEKELAKLEPEKEAVKENEEQFSMTLQEIMERRKDAARFRAQQSYKEAKANRQKKIKSKKYHRIQRRERVKEQLKEFEELQKTNPQAALEKLDQLDKNRALERMSLRHKSTGEWAKNKQIRAKYDKESRQVLAQQLSISKELTQKVQKVEDSEDDENNEEPIKLSASDKENPWVNGAKTQTEVDEFVSSYRKYWDNKKNELNEKSSDDKTLANTQNEINVSKTDNITNGERTVDTDEKLEKPLCQRTKCSTTIRHGRLPKMLNPVMEVITEYTQKNNKTTKHSIDSATNENNKRPQTIKNYEKSAKRINKKAKEELNRDQPIRTKNKVTANGSLSDRENKEETESSAQEERANVNEGLSEENTGRTGMEKKSYGLCTSSTSAWAVESVPNSRRHETSISNVEKISEIFDAMEDEIEKKVKSKLKQVKRQCNNVDKIEKRKAKKRKQKNEEYDNGLGLKNKRQRPIIDEPMMEGVSKELSDENSDLITKSNDLVNANLSPVKSTQTVNEIDPNKYIHVKPQHLKTHMPDIATAGNDLLDDSENEEEKHMIISEAFADDDVVEEFRKEKEEEIKKSQPEEIDLSMPGWGSWGGRNIKVSSRKRIRFILKIPEVAQRKDENKGDVVIIEENKAKIREHQVSDLPYPFNTVKDFEASIRAPIGRDFVPENAHRQLIDPPVRTAMGKIIEPMDEDILVDTKKIAKRKSVQEKKSGKKRGQKKMQQKKVKEQSKDNKSHKQIKKVDAVDVK